MSAQILLFPARRIRRLTIAGKMDTDLMLVSINEGIPSVANNYQADLLYRLFPPPKLKKR